MRLILRCSFFLSIVYGAILRDEGRLPELPTSAARALPQARAFAQDRIAAGAGMVCGRDPAACLPMATTLGHLLAPAVAMRDGSPSGRTRQRIRDAAGPLAP